MEKTKTIRLSWIAVLLVVVLLCVGAYFIATQIVNARMPRLRDVITLPASSNQAIQPLGDGAIYFDGGSLHALDGRGRQIWGYPAGSSARFSVSDGGVATWSGTMLSLLDPSTGAALYSGNVENNVISARLGKTYAAVQLEKEPEAGAYVIDPGKEHNSVMLILDTGGRQVDKIELTNQTVLDFGFFSNGQLFWVMSLNTEGTVPICTISSYKPRKMLTGTVTDTEQFLYDVIFQSTKIRAVGLMYIKDFDYTGKEITANRILVYGWYLIDVDEHQQNPLMVFVPTAQADSGAGITELRTIQGQSDVSIRLPSAARQVFARGDAIYAFANDRVMVCRVGELEPVSYGLPGQMRIDNVIALTDNHSAIVTSGSAVYLIPLP